jgi:hypothetical protein
MYFVKTSNTTTITLSDTYEGATKNLTSSSTGEVHFLYTTRAYGANTFNALTTLNITGASGTFIRNEIVTGTTSLATAKVAFANSTVVKVGVISGTFLYTSNGYTSELLSGEISDVTASISSINNPDIQPYTSSILYIDNVEKITRSNSDFEQAYLILTL